MSTSRVILDAPRLQLTLQRLAHHVREYHLDYSQCCVIGVQPRGVLLAQRLHSLLQALAPGEPLPYGDLDVTFFRDDFRRGSGPLVPNSTNINFLIEDKTVILVDDVLYTGRTIRAAMDAMLAFGRPRSVELLVLVDRRRKRELPVQAFYTGVAIDTLDNEKVLVQWQQTHGTDSVVIAPRHT